jgi:hypothetical protein
MKALRYALFAFILHLFFQPVYAQRFRQKNSLSNWEFGLLAGVYIYQGDLTPQALGSLKTPKFGINGFAARILSSTLSVRGNLAWSALVGNEALYKDPAWRTQRALSFRSSLVELSALGVVNLRGTNYETDLYYRRLTPYLMAGAGFSFLNVRRNASRFNPEFFNDQPKVTQGLATDLTRRPARIVPVIPVGAGIRYPVSEKFSVAAEALYRLSFTDYMDGFSQVANPKLRDHYYNVSVGLVYRPGRRSAIGCPAVQ